jgi:hydrogenase maturation protein HypF
VAAVVTSSSTQALSAGRILLQGCVQGAGIRPRIARSAARAGITGRVRNTMSGVVIDAEGCESVLRSWCHQLSTELPGQPDSQWLSFESRSDRAYDDFHIDESDLVDRVQTTVPLDRVVCDKCLADTFTTDNRRYGYAFTSCTDCGPRYSILEAMPFDRIRTSMNRFAMCDDCAREYDDPSDRRFHSQTNSCPCCGPRLWSTEPASSLCDRSPATGQPAPVLEGIAAWQAVASSLLRGQIAAIKGVGGYQLLCDATHDEAVARLRQRKRRTAKPLAVMVGSIKEAEVLAHISAVERETLSNCAGPIVLVRERRTSPLSCDIHPGLGDVGLMLPTSPLHALLSAAVTSPLVVTSGNIDGDPLSYDEDEAEQALAGIADCFLHHDRPIVRAIDDSVVRCIADRVVTIRLGRGLAPMPVELGCAQVTLGRTQPVPAPTDSAIAVGGQQKASLALISGGQAVLGPHLGDLDSLASRDRFLQQVDSIKQLYHAAGASVAHDSHPDYYSTRWALQNSSMRTSVQHHHAHVVSAMVEHGLLDKEVLGVAFDGTGLGTDGTIWGGEFLIATAGKFIRVGHLLQFGLLGGEQAIRQPWRIAAALLIDSEASDYEAELQRLAPDTTSVRTLRSLLSNPSISPRSSSAGRLFDGVASIVLRRPLANHQGELAMCLEAVCDPAESGAYPMPIRDSDPLVIDWRLMIEALLRDHRAGVPVGRIAMRFHRGLAIAVKAFVDRFPHTPLVFSGGVFHNRVLVELIADSLTSRTEPVGFPSRVPPGDGGLSLGQLAVSLHPTEG